LPSLGFPQNLADMKVLRVFRHRVVTVVILLLLGAVFPGCSKKENLALDTASFNSAPPELSEKWKAAANYASGNNYLGAATNLIDIFSKSQQLTPDQNDALNQAWMKLGNLAFAAANAGDKGATEAVLKMKETGIGERRGQP
jgi:hypothetical protein